jgi:small subunit ribosomal protein S1
MSENTQAAEAPANAVEASQGNSIEPNPAPPSSALDASATGTPAPSAEGSVEQEGASAGSDAPEGGDAEGDDEGEGEAGGEGAEASGEGAAADPNRKKRKRRRKKKGPKPEGAQAQGEPGAERPHGKPHREGPAGVFSRFFDGGHAGKRHAFSAGEVVAGRVLRANEGAFTIDLFGKAIAFVDIFEPHEVPLLPEPPPPPPVEAPKPEASAEAVVAEGAPAEGDAVDTAAVSEGAPVEVAPSDVATPPEQIAEVSSEAVQAEAAASAPQTEAEGHGEAEGEGHEEAHALEDAGHEAHDAAHEETAAEPEPEPPPAPDLGSIFRGRIGSVAESGHVVIVNRIIDVPAAKKRIVDAREKRKRVRGLVFGYNRGGFDVLVEGIRVFCPASGISLGPIDSPDELLGQRLEFTVPPVKAGTHGLVVSRRGIIERQQRKAAKQLFRSLAPGQRLKGRVTQIREFGLFVDLGGIEGLVHQSELSFSRGVRPQDAAQVGDEVDVQVLRVGEGQTRKERERVSLSMKALQDDPWGAHADVLEPGSVITGKVVRTTEFGAFIEIAPHIEGLLHISELGRELKHANQALNEGQELRVVVERVDRKVRRISLSKLSQAEEKAIEAGTDQKSGRPPKPGQQVTVVVDKVDQAGLIVQVPGVFGRRGRGFIPNSEMGTERGTDHRKGFPPGTQIPAKVIGIDRDGGFRFSRKALLVEEEKRAIQDYRREAARQGLGTFGDLLRKKLEGGKS